MLVLVSINLLLHYTGHRHYDGNVNSHFLHLLFFFFFIFLANLLFRLGIRILDRTLLLFLFDETLDTVHLNFLLLNCVSEL